MLKKEAELSVDKSLSDALEHDALWQKAYGAAKKAFDDMVLFNDLRDQVHDILFAGLANIELQKVEVLNGKVSLREVFDNPAVLLEVEYNMPEKGLCNLEVIFDESGSVLHVAN